MRDEIYSNKWGTDFAGILKQFQQGSKIGVITGKVVGLVPLSISILSGEAIINSNVQNVYVTEKLTKERKSCCSSCQNWNPIEPMEDNCTSWEPLEEGDIVMIVPNETEKIFYVIDRVSRE